MHNTEHTQYRVHSIIKQMQQGGSETQVALVCVLFFFTVNKTVFELLKQKQQNRQTSSVLALQKQW